MTSPKTRLCTAFCVLSSLLWLGCAKPEADLEPHAEPAPPNVAKTPVVEPPAEPAAPTSEVLAFEMNPSEDTVRRWVAQIPADPKRQVPASLREQANYAIAQSEAAHGWVDVYGEIELPASASPQALAAAKATILNALRRAGASRATEGGNGSRMVGFDVRREVLEAVLHTGWMHTLHYNHAIRIGDCSKGC